jgi:magnesium-transporting ATPase (P-type)
VKRLDKAERALDRREERLRQVYDSVENNLELIGAIGIEDRLQVEILLNIFFDESVTLWTILSLSSFLNLVYH